MRLLLAQTRDQVHATEATLSAQLGRVETQLGELTAHVDAAAEARTAEHAQLVEILRRVHDLGHWRRARLRELRAEDAYERAYADPDPLVSVVIPTYDNHQLLRERSIPSVLAQSYQNFEIVVVGDAAPEEARVALESFDDPRITFFNRSCRGPYPDDPATRWLVAGVPPYNEAVRRARGAWIAPLDDDDAFRPEHLERLLTHAREHRLELCYGQLCMHRRDGTTEVLGRFPPQNGAFGLQSTLYHAGLAGIFELELADAAFGMPYDWGLALRMMEADVRIGMVEQQTTDYYPSRDWTPRWQDERSQRPDPPEWEYVAEGFARARAGGQPAEVGWSADGVARAYREKWPSFLEAVEGSGPLGVSHEVTAGAAVERHDVLAQNAVLAFAYALARADPAARPVSVLDYGGALGHFYVLARRLFPELELDYHCRELPAVCAEGRKLLPEVSFHDTSDCLRSSYDLVIASGSLQYEEDWPPLLADLASASRGWMLFTRVPIVLRHPSFVVLQRAHAYGYQTEYLGWVFNRDELLSRIGASGFAVERELVLGPDVSVDGAPARFTHAGFLCRRDGEA